MMGLPTATAGADVDAGNHDVGRGVVDCDIHPHFREGLRDLTPYMTETWRRRLGVGTDNDWAANLYASAFQVPYEHLYINPSGAMMADTARPGMAPCTDAAFTAEDLLDRFGIHRGLLVSGSLLGLGAMPDPRVAAAIASAHNDWMAEQWLAVDDRYRGALVVAPQDPEAAADEIDRFADRPGIAGVFMPLHGLAMGERHYYPIYEAAQRHELPVCVHPSGTEDIYNGAPRTAARHTFYLEWKQAVFQIHQSNVLSLICQGVFERFPRLKVVVIEGGFMWAAETMWKLDRDWHGLRDEVPWLKRRPSEYLLDHIRFTTQPFVEPHRREHLAAVIEMVYGERTLLFSSDYPHWDFDNPMRVLGPLDEPTRRRILTDNAYDTFGERLA
jgi:predicted TIM-barrel fold metal-dependent hydrolase